MKMDELAGKWLQRARYDLESAQAMLKTKRYIYVAFLCQQALEKILKAIIINQGRAISRTHNLVRLAEMAEIYSEMKPEYKDFLANITPFAIEARYGDYRESLSEIVNRKKAIDYFNTSQELFQWLVKRI